MVNIQLVLIEFRYGFLMPRPPKSGGAVFEPRTFAENRRKFGRSGSRLLSHKIESPQQGAAELQHAVANRIREYLLDVNTDLKTFCEKAELVSGLSYERFQRINRGETMMTLTDLMFWATVIPNFHEFVAQVVYRLRKVSDSEVVEGSATRSQPSHL